MVIFTNKKDEKSVSKALKTMGLSGDGILTLNRIGSFRGSGDTIRLYDNGDYYLVLEKDSELGTESIFITFDFANVDRLDFMPEKKGRRQRCLARSNQKGTDQDLIIFLLAHDDIFFEYKDKLLGMLEDYDNNCHDSLYVEESKLNMHSSAFRNHVFVKSSDDKLWFVYECLRRDS